MSKFSMFIPLTKIDEKTRTVYGVATAERPDRAKEICDYEKSLPYYREWSEGFDKATGGKSLGNVRAMHNKVAAGKVTKINFNDDAKQIEIAAQIVDDQEWKKVIEGVYTGFSQGGEYAEKWADPVKKGFTRYAAKPSEISLVDLPCLPEATFEAIKVDGTSEMRKFAPLANDAIVAKAKELAKAAGDEGTFGEYLADAAAVLNKVDEKPATPTNVGEGFEQVWLCKKDNTTHATKDALLKHMREMEAREAAEAAAAPLNGSLDQLDKALGEAGAPAPEDKPVGGDAKQDGGDGAQPAVVEKKDYSTDQRQRMASKGEAMKDGSFPIKNKADLERAVQAYGRAKNKAEAKAHIISRAKALGATDVLPASWEGSTKKEEKAEIAGRLKKGLDHVSRLCCLISELEWLQCCVEQEAEYERDNSTLPAELKEDITNLCATLRNMVTEETAELLDDDEMDEIGQLLESVEVMEMASRAGAMEKVAGAKLEGPAKDRFGKALALLRSGGEKVTKVEPNADLQKISIELAKSQARTQALEAMFTAASARISSLVERVAKMEKRPAPPKASAMHVPGATVVGKAQDGTPSGAAESADPVEAFQKHLDSLSAEERSKALMKAALSNGRVLAN